MTLWTAACQSSLSFTISQSWLELISIESIMPSNHFILCCPLLLLPSVFPSIRVISSELALHVRWPKYWSLSLSISSSSECSGLISFRIDWFDLFASKGHSRVFSNIIVWKHQFFSAQPFFIVQLSHPYMTTGKIKSIWTFVVKVMSLLFNMLSRYVCLMSFLNWNYLYNLVCLFLLSSSP